MFPGLLPIFLHSCEIKAGSGLGTRLTLTPSYTHTLPPSLPPILTPSHPHSLLHSHPPPSLPPTPPQMPWASQLSLVRAVWRWRRKGGSAWKPSHYATLATSSIATACSFSCAFLASGTILCMTTQPLFLRSSKMWVGFVSPSQESWNQISVRVGNETGLELYQP